MCFFWIFWYGLCSFDIINQDLLVMRKVILLFQSAYINLVCFIRDGKKKRCGKKVANAHKKGLRKVAGVKTKRKEKKLILRKKFIWRPTCFIMGLIICLTHFPETSSDFNFSLGGSKEFSWKRRKSAF